MTPLDGSSPAAGDRGDGDVIDLGRLLEQAVEEKPSLARAAPVEAEGELVEVEVELVRPGGALVGAEEPPLQQRRNAVDAGHRDVRRVAAGVETGRVVEIAVVAEPAVAVPVVV